MHLFRYVYWQVGAGMVSYNYYMRSIKRISIYLLLLLMFAGCSHTKVEQAGDDSVASSTEGIVEKELSKDSRREPAPASPVVPQSEEPSIAAEEQRVFRAPEQADVGALLQGKITATIRTNRGSIVVELLPERAPFTVANFVNLAQGGFYEGIKFHRVIPGFMIQTGDPNSKDNEWGDDGIGGPGYTFADEVSPDDQIVRGVLAMANAGPHTNGSQFFIVTAESTPWLNGKHTIFGSVKQGMEIVDVISNVPRSPVDHPLEDVVIEKIIIN